MEEIIKKIEKLLALAEKNPNENEAAAAALKAQELMAKFNLDESNFKDKDNGPKITVKFFKEGKGYKWRYQLSLVIARNFRVKTYVLGKDWIAFYGYEMDVDIALQTFSSLFKIGNKLATKVYYEYKNAGKSTKGIMNTYYAGFIKGIGSKLDEQCKALMIVIPEEVNAKYAEYSKNFGTMKSNFAMSANNEVFERGIMDGRLAINSGRIEAHRN